MERVSQELLVLNADIVSFAEVQDCYVLGRLNALLPTLDYLPYLVKGTDTATGQNVGILTRVDPVVSLQRTALRVSYPIDGSQCGTSSSGTSAVSKHYYTTFNISGLPRPLSLMGMHFLAYPDDKYRCVQREAQASVIKSLVATALESGNSAIVVGDLNDFDGLVKDQANSTPISQVLNLLRDPLPSPVGDELTNAASLVAQSTRYSYWYDQNSDCGITPKELTSIDHMLFSNDLAPFVVSVNFAHTYAAVCDSDESDHWPIVMTLRTGNSTESWTTVSASTSVPPAAAASSSVSSSTLTTASSIGSITSSVGSTDGEQVTTPGKGTSAGTVVGVLFAGILIGSVGVGIAWFIVNKRSHTHRFVNPEEDNSAGLMVN